MKGSGYADPGTRKSRSFAPMTGFTGIFHGSSRVLRRLPTTLPTTCRKSEAIFPAAVRASFAIGDRFVALPLLDMHYLLVLRPRLSGWGERAFNVVLSYFTKWGNIIAILRRPAEYLSTVIIWLSLSRIIDRSMCVCQSLAQPWCSKLRNPPASGHSGHLHRYRCRILATLFSKMNTTWQGDSQSSLWNQHR